MGYLTNLPFSMYCSIPCGYRRVHYNTLDSNCQKPDGVKAQKKEGNEGVGKAKSIKWNLSACSIIMKMLFQSSLCWIKRCNHNNTLNCRKNQPCKSNRILITMVYRNMYQSRWYNHYPSYFPPKLSAVVMRKFPGIHIFHGASCPVSRHAIDAFRTMFPHHSSANKHCNRNEQIVN